LPKFGFYIPRVQNFISNDKNAIYVSVIFLLPQKFNKDFLFIYLCGLLRFILIHWLQQSEWQKNVALRLPY